MMVDNAERHFHERPLLMPHPLFLPFFYYSITECSSLYLLTIKILLFFKTQLLTLFLLYNFSCRECPSGFYKPRCLILNFTWLGFCSVSLPYLQNCWLPMWGTLSTHHRWDTVLHVLNISETEDRMVIGQKTWTRPRDLKNRKLEWTWIIKI